MYFINPPIAKLKPDAAYLAITYCKTVHNYLGTSEDSTLNVHRSDVFSIFIQLSSSARRLLRRGTRVIQKVKIQHGLGGEGKSPLRRWQHCRVQRLYLYFLHVQRTLIKNAVRRTAIYIVLRRQINFDRDQKRAAIICLAPSGLTVAIFIGLINEEQNGGPTI